MIRILILMLLPGLALAETRPPTGLLAVASSLTATIPFQVRAPEGQDYAIVLTDGAGARVISAYLRGGSVLRLLVPPGDHRVTVAPGPPEDWQDPDALFGAPAVTLPGPLTFRITDNRREGQSITLEEDEEGLRITDRQDRTTCQIAEWTSERITKTTPLGTELRWLDPDLSTRSRPCD